MNKLINLFKLFTNKKFFIRIPKNIDVLIFGKTIKSFNLKKKIFILDNQIFILILLKSLIKNLLNRSFSLSKLNNIYFYETIKIISPKIALGNEINMNIFKFKKFFPEKIAIAYQCVQWSNLLKGSLKRYVKNSKYPLTCDYFFVYDQNSKKLLNFVKSKFIISGSVRNNEIITKKRRMKKYDIMFISEYRDKIGREKLKYESGINKVNDLKLSHILISQSLIFQSFILRALNEIQKENNLKVCIALASNRAEKKDNVDSKNEEKFLKENIEEYHTEPISSYQLAENSKISITFMSTLGKELLSRNHKVMFVLYSKFKFINGKYLPNSSGKYWYEGKNINQLKKKILNLIKTNEKKWSSYLNKKNIGYSYDKGNKKLKKLILKLC